MRNSMSIMLKGKTWAARWGPSQLGCSRTCSQLGVPLRITHKVSSNSKGLLIIAMQTPVESPLIRTRRHLFSNISTTIVAGLSSNTSKKKRKPWINNKAHWRRTSLGTPCLSVTSLGLTCGCWSPQNWTVAVVFMLSITSHSLNNWYRGIARAGANLMRLCNLHATFHKRRILVVLHLRK